MKYYSNSCSRFTSAILQVFIFLSGSLCPNAFQIDPSMSNHSHNTECEFYDHKCFENAKNDPTINSSVCHGIEKCNYTEEYVHSCQVTWALNDSSNTETYRPKHDHKHASGHIVYQMGCFPQLRTQLSVSDCQDIESCTEDRTKHNVKNRRGVLFCCCKGNMCNTNFSWTPKTFNETVNPINEDESSFDVRIYWYILIPIIMLIMLLVVFYFLYRNGILFKSKRHQIDRLNNVVEYPCGESETLLLKPMETIELVEVKAKGRFIVWEGIQQKSQASVAVKIFSVMDKASWNAEKDIYKLLQVDHLNILKFIAIDIIFNQKKISEYRLITEFHPRGSLYDLLKNHLLSWDDLCSIAIGMARGLDYLHEEYTNGKPAIAHRDFKSKNILIKSDLTPCLADFGLALVFERGQPIGDTYPQVGTRRYMAPEVLEGAIIFSRDQFFRIDMYAFGLVLWELISRCATLWHTVNDAIVDQTHNTDMYDKCNTGSESKFVEDFRLPFEIESGVSNPSLDQMQDLVINLRLRPQFREDWNQHLGMKKMIRTTRECWDQDSEARISASCVMERIQAIQSAKKDLILSNPSQNCDH